MNNSRRINSSAKRVPPEWTSTGDKRWKGAHKLRHVLLSGAEICSLSFTVKVFPIDPAL